ncbi:hypothetical protein MFLAVUS_004513 [Mucor flavus]|uniref:Chromatin assembly factor 1 subunit A dimerization domain-containing protein n=1 Tax=Mucor flavus TaxID=439312 RepID=A0ABP9YW85_9FUNG
MNLDTEMTNGENAPIHFISEKMETLRVPDNTLVCQYLKDGKLYFNEPKLRAESHVKIAEKLLAYREYRANIEKDDNITQLSVEIPPMYMDLIAALVQDSEEPFTVLSTRIDDLLSPFLRNENASNKFESSIQKAIKKLARKVNYGLKEEVYANIEHSAPKIPWRIALLILWEVKDIQLLPEDMQQAVYSRIENRKHMTDVFTEFIESLPSTERSTIINTKHRRSPIAHKELEDIRQKQSTEIEQRKKKDEEKKKRDEEKKLHDEQKRVLEEEKKKQREEEKKHRDEEKKKREDEKKKKEQSQLRLTSLFAKTSIFETAPPVEKILEPVNPTLFPAFYIKDNVTIADRSQSQRSSGSYHNFRRCLNSSAPVSVNNFLSEMKEPNRKRGVSTRIDIRTLLLPGSADILHVPNVRLVLRMKLLQFTENVRPAYYGTFTKRSQTVAGRRPFAKDESKLEYDIDSEAEWEPEGEGEDIVSGDEDDDDPNTDMIDPEDSGWLVPEGYLSDNEGVEDEEYGDRDVGKALNVTSSTKRIAVRKIVLGPYFEGETEEDDAMKPFETQFFVDLPEGGFNPFFKEPSTSSTATTAAAAPTTATTHVKASDFTNEHTTALINVINEKSGDSIPNLITEAKSNWLLKDVSKRQLEAKIKNIAIKEKRGKDTKPTCIIEVLGIDLKRLLNQTLSLA